MNFLFSDVGALSRAVVGLVTLSLVACSSPHVPDPAAFELTAGAKRARFPQVQNIGVVELSGARISERPFEGSTDEREYVATGGALLVKKLASPIQAQAPEILVTPEAALLRGRQAMVKKDGQLITAEGDSTQFIIDGTQLKIEGPHSILTLATGEKKLMASASAMAEPKPEPMKVEVSKPVKKPAQELAVRSAPKPAVKSVAKPAAKPSVKPAPKVDRSALLNLMREPSE